MNTPVNNREFNRNCPRKSENMETTLSSFLAEDFGAEMNGLCNNEPLEITSNPTNEQEQVPNRGGGGGGGGGTNNEIEECNTNSIPKSRIRKWNIFKIIYRKLSGPKSTEIRAEIASDATSERDPKFWNFQDDDYRINSVLLVNNLDRYVFLINNSNNLVYTKPEFMSQLILLEQELSSQQD